MSKEKKTGHYKTMLITILIMILMYAYRPLISAILMQLTHALTYGEMMNLLQTVVMKCHGTLILVYLGKLQFQPVFFVFVYLLMV